MSAARLLPRLVIPTRRGLPPVVACRRRRDRPRAKVRASPTAATGAVALRGPMPGIFVRRSSVILFRLCYELGIKRGNPIIQHPPTWQHILDQETNARVYSLVGVRK